jgi:hypothetical protein
MREETRNHAPPIELAWLLAAASVCLAVLAASGCSGRSDGLSPVSGKVSAGGQPLKTGSVTFRPDTSKGNQTLHHPTGDIDAEGNYLLYTIGKKGAPPGWYKVLVFADGNPSPAPGIPPRWLHHIKYTTEGTTDVLIEVVPNPPPGNYDLNLSR